MATTSILEPMRRGGSFDLSPLDEGDFIADVNSSFSFHATFEDDDGRETAELSDRTNIFSNNKNKKDGGSSPLAMKARQLKKKMGLGKDKPHLPFKTTTKNNRARSTSQNTTTTESTTLTDNTTGVVNHVTPTNKDSSSEKLSNLVVEAASKQRRQLSNVSVNSMPKLRPAPENAGTVTGAKSQKIHRDSSKLSESERSSSSAESSSSYSTIASMMYFNRRTADDEDLDDYEKEEGIDIALIMKDYGAGLDGASIIAADEESVFLDEISLILLERLHRDDSKSVLRALDKLADACANSDEASRQACNMGAPATLVSVMKKWRDNKNVQAKVFRAMIALTMVHDASHVQKTLWMSSAVDHIVQAMRAFPDSRSVQFLGLNVLLSLMPAAESRGTKMKKWMGRRFVGEMQGVKVIAQAMREFPKEVAVQEAGCSVLLKLATFMNEGKERNLLLKSGAVSAFSIAVENHADDESFQGYVMLFMNILNGKSDLL